MAGKQQPVSQTLTLRLRNTRPDTQRLYLEPWGSEYPMPPGALFEIVARGPEGDGLEVEVGEGAMIVWGWSGSVVCMLQDGVALGPRLEACVPVPETLPGSDVRGFLRMMLGRSDDE